MMELAQQHHRKIPMGAAYDITATSNISFMPTRLSQCTYLTTYMHDQSGISGLWALPRSFVRQSLHEPSDRFTYTSRRYSRILVNASTWITSAFIESRMYRDNLSLPHLLLSRILTWQNPLLIWHLNSATCLIVTASQLFQWARGWSGEGSTYGRLPSAFTLCEI
jgi:hypothetical protein